MRKIIAAFAAAAAIGLTATPALAAPGGSPSGTWSGSFTVPETISMSLSSNSFTVTPDPGQYAYTNAPGSWASPAEEVAVSTNDGAGYTVTEQVTTPFSSGSNTIPANWYSAWTGKASGYVAFGAGGGAITIGSTSGPSGNLAGSYDGQGDPFTNSSGADVYPAGFAITMAANQPSGTYTGAVTFTALGN